MNTFFRLLSYSKPYSRFLPEYLVFALLAVVFGVFNFSLLIPLLNVLFGTVKMPEVLTEPPFQASVSWLIECRRQRPNLDWLRCIDQHPCRQLVVVRP